MRRAGVRGEIVLEAVDIRTDRRHPSGVDAVLKVLVLTAGEFRRRLPFPQALQRYQQTFVTPYRDRLRAFHPLGTMPGDHGQTAA